ncbi:MAG TPA: ice-binding family protein, partial [Chthoniobacterales bacterium]
MVRSVVSGVKGDQWSFILKFNAAGKTALFVSGLAAALCLHAAAQAVSLGAAQDLAVLGGSTVTNTGVTSIVGGIGVSPGTSVTGFPPGVVADGAIHAGDAAAAQAQADLATAYATLAGEAPDTVLSGQNLGGLTLTPGVYRFATSAQLNGTLSLDTQGDPNATFVIQIGTTLTTATNSAVTLVQKTGSDPNIFWQVGSSATLGSNTSFNGNILAFTSIVLNTGTALEVGKALAMNGAVTMDTNFINGLGGGTFWTGSSSNLWSGANWSPDATGAVSSTLVNGGDVVFSATGAQGENTTLDYDATIASLTVNDPTAVTISGPHTLAINGAGLTGGITVNNGAGLTTINSALNLSGTSQTLTVNNASGLVINGSVGGTIGLTKAGTGQLILTGAETYTGPTEVSAGTLQVGDGTTTGTAIASSGPVTVDAGATLALDLSTGGLFGNDVSNSGLVTTIASGANAVSGVISGSGAFTQNGPGYTFLTGANSYTGATTVLQGTLQIGDGSVGTISAAGPVAISNGAVLALNLPAGETFGNTVDDEGLMTNFGPGITTISGVISGTGAFSENNANGTVILTGENTYTGSTTVGGGTVQIGNGSTGSISAASPVIDQGSLVIDLADGGIFANSILDNGLVNTIASGANTLSGVISGTGAFLQSGSGRTILTGENTYSGGTTVSSGVLSVASDANLGNAAGLLTLKFGGELLTTADFTSGRSISLDPPAPGPGIITASGQGPTNTLAAAADTTATYTGVIFGVDGLQIGDATNTGTVVLAGANTYTGGTAVQPSTTLIAEANTALGADLVTLHSGTLLIPYAGVALANPVYFGVGGGTFINAGTLNNNVLDASGNCGCPQTVVNVGAINGDVLLGSGPNTVLLYSGSAITGNLDLGSNSGSTLTLSGVGDQLWSAAVTGTEANQGSLLKQGLGTWTLDRDVTAPAGTTVAYGGLVVNATLISPQVTVDSGATTGGTGTVAGNLTNNGLVQPGSATSPGTLQVTGHYAQGPSGSYSVRLASPTAYDQ